MELALHHPIWLLLGAVLMALVPIFIGMCTAYVKVSVVLGMLRSGIGAQGVPSSLTTMVLSLAITAFIMSPVLEETIEASKKIESFNFEKIPSESNIQTIIELLKPWINFMETHTGQREKILLSQLANNPNKDIEISKENSNVRILLLAYVLSELRQGFLMGFVILLPFLAIDLIVGNVLAALGMHMLSPAMVSLPIKLILFVVADGWLLLTKGLIQSY
jgi:type III secretion protein R